MNTLYISFLESESRLVNKLDYSYRRLFYSKMAAKYIKTPTIKLKAKKEPAAPTLYLTYVCLLLKLLHEYKFIWRRERDSNPRTAYAV